MGWFFFNRVGSTSFYDGYDRQLNKISRQIRSLQVSCRFCCSSCFWWEVVVDTLWMALKHPWRYRRLINFKIRIVKCFVCVCVCRNVV